MNLWVLGGVLCMVVGILVILYTFRIQQQEDCVRMPGYYTSAIVAALEPKTEKERQLTGKVTVTFEFTKNFKVQHYKEQYPFEETKGLAVGRTVLIVYDEQQKHVYINPMKKYRIRQAVFLLVGGLLLLTGIFWTIAFYGFVPN